MLILNERIACIADVSFSRKGEWTSERASRQVKEHAWGEKKMERSGEGVSKKGEGTPSSCSLIFRTCSQFCSLRLLFFEKPATQANERTVTWIFSVWHHYIVIFSVWHHYIGGTTYIIAQFYIICIYYCTMCRFVSTGSFEIPVNYVQYSVEWFSIENQK